MENFDLKQYMDVIDRVNNNQIAYRKEGRTTTIARLILEGGRTFDKDQTYQVALLVPSIERSIWLCKALWKIIGEEEFVFSYWSVQKNGRRIWIDDHGYRPRIEIFVVPCSDPRGADILRGRRIHNYFLDVSDCDDIPYLPSILDEMDYITQKS